MGGLGFRLKKVGRSRRYFVCSRPNRFNMFDCLSLIAMNLLASHAMPNLLFLLVLRTWMWGIVPIFVFAVLGSKIGWTPIRRRQLSAATFGVLAGSITTMLAAILTQAIIPSPPPWYSAIVSGCFSGCGVAYVVARVGRPPFDHSMASEVRPNEKP